MNVTPDKEYLKKFTAMKMPFGKYAGWLLIDLPEPYVVWFKQKGFPKGQLGDMLGLLYEIKVNGLEYLFDPIRTSAPQHYPGSGYQSGGTVSGQINKKKMKRIL
jgi:uncharacterized protein (DUF3820 family)